MMQSKEIIVGAAMVSGVVIGGLAAVAALSVRHPATLTELTARVDAIENRVALLVETGSRARADAVRPPSDRPETPTETAELDLSGVATKGTSSANVALIEFSDPQCPFCGRYARETFGKIDATFVQTGQVLYALRHFPLESIHPLAFKASVALDCARNQGRMWELHRNLFERQQVTPEYLVKHAAVAGLDVRRFESCMGQSAATQVKADLAEGRRLGVRSTPTFLVASADSEHRRWTVRQRIVGAQPFEVFQAALAAVIGQKDTKIASGAMK